MLPENIDLTENRDFGGRFIIPHTDVPTNEWLAEDERVFGKRHRSERYRIFEFGKYEMDGFCVHCGRQLIPWKRNRRELCRDCIREMNGSDKKLPWRKGGTQSPFTDSNFRVKRDLFGLR